MKIEQNWGNVEEDHTSIYSLGLVQCGAVRVGPTHRGYPLTWNMIVSFALLLEVLLYGLF